MNEENKILLETLDGLYRRQAKLKEKLASKQDQINFSDNYNEDEFNNDVKEIKNIQNRIDTISLGAGIPITVITLLHALVGNVFGVVAGSVALGTAAIITDSRYNAEKDKILEKYPEKDRPALSKIMDLQIKLLYLQKKIEKKIEKKNKTRMTIKEKI